MEILKGLGALALIGLGLTLGGFIGAVIAFIFMFLLFVWGDEWFA